MGSFRSSMYQLNIAGEAASSKVSKFQRFRGSKFQGEAPPKHCNLETLKP
jgi:hypothetical protein